MEMQSPKEGSALQRQHYSHAITDIAEADNHSVARRLGRTLSAETSTGQNSRPRTGENVDDVDDVYDAKTRSRHFIGGSEKSACS